MRLCAVLLCFVLVQNALGQTRYYKFSELNGFTGNDGKVHLFYRLHYSDSSGNPNQTENSIYHYNLSNNSDTLFLRDFQSGELIENVIGLDFWQKNPDHYIHCGAQIGFAVNGYIKRYDQAQAYITSDIVEGLVISKSNDSLLYAWDPLLKSTDGGRTWNAVSTPHKIISVSPYNTNLMFGRNASGQLVRSLDAGSSFEVVDTNQAERDIFVNFFPSGNKICIYQKYNGGYRLIASVNSGSAFSWQVVFKSPRPFIFAPNENDNGRYYLAQGTKIYTNINTLFDLQFYAELPRRITGLFSPSTGSFLYVATMNSLQKVKPDTAISDKKLILNPELFEFYPLVNGYTWFYDVQQWDMFPAYYAHYTQKQTIVKDTVMTNGKSYKMSLMVSHGSGYTETNYYRIDTADGYLWSFVTSENAEYRVHDFVYEPGDTVPYGFIPAPYSFGGTVFDSAYNQVHSGQIHKVKTYKSINMLESYSFDLAEGLGNSYFIFGYDFGRRWGVLKGWIFDGVISGDTTFTDVEDNSSRPGDFSLEQNYPNPFNPSTTINYQLPINSFVTLKVYDILGNEVATLVNEGKTPGTYEVEFPSSAKGLAPSDFPSGIYFYRIQAGKFAVTKKMIQLK